MTTKTRTHKHIFSAPLFRIANFSRIQVRHLQVIFALLVTVRSYINSVLLIGLPCYPPYPPFLQASFSSHISPGSPDFLSRSSQQPSSCPLTPVAVPYFSEIWSRCVFAIISHLPFFFCVLKISKYGNNVTTDCIYSLIFSTLLLLLPILRMLRTS